MGYKKATKKSKTAGGIVVRSVIDNGSLKAMYESGNTHHTIIGSTGSGKTQSVIFPSIISIADSNYRENVPGPDDNPYDKKFIGTGASMVINDPKIELFKLLSPYLKERGYICRLLDMTDPQSGSQFSQTELINQRYKEVKPSLYMSKAIHLILKYMHNLDVNYANTDEDGLSGLNYKNKPEKFPLFDKEKIIVENNGELSSPTGIVTFLQMLVQAAQSKTDADFKKDENSSNPEAHNPYLWEKQTQTIKAMNEVVQTLADYVFTSDKTGVEAFFKSRIQDFEDTLKDMAESGESKAIRRRIDGYKQIIAHIEDPNADQLEIMYQYLETLEDYHLAIYQVGDEFCVQNAKTIATMIVESRQGGSPKGERIWTDTSTAFLTSLILTVCREGLHQAESHLGSVYMIMANMTSAIGGKATNPTPLDMITNSFLPNDTIKLAQASVSVAGEKTRSSIMVSSISPMDLFSEPSVVAQCCKTDFDLEECQERPVAYFLNTPGADSTSPYTLLSSLFIEQFYTVLSNYCQYSKDLSLKRPVYFLLDEFCNMPAIPNFGSKCSLARSKKIRLNIVVQSLDQLNINYKDDRTLILENSNWIYLLTNSNDTAELLSKRLGKETIEISTTSSSSSSNGTTKNASTSASTNNSVLGRELMTPEEVMHMPHEHGLYIQPRLDPFKTDLAYIYKTDIWQHLLENQLLEVHQKRPRTVVQYFLPENYVQFVLAYKLFWENELFDSEFRNTFAKAKTEYKPPAVAEEKHEELSAKEAESSNGTKANGNISDNATADDSLDEYSF